MFHKTLVLKVLTTLAWSFPLVFGLVSEQQTLRSTVVQLVTYPSTGLHSTEVRISDSRLQIYSASIDIKFVLAGYRYYLYHWYLTCLAFGTLFVSNIYLILFRWISHKLFGGDVGYPEDVEPHEEAAPAPSARVGVRGAFAHADAFARADWSDPPPRPVRPVLDPEKVKQGLSGRGRRGGGAAVSVADVLSSPPDPVGPCRSPREGNGFPGGPSFPAMLEGETGAMGGAIDEWVDDDDSRGAPLSSPSASSADGNGERFRSLETDALQQQSSALHLGREPPEGHHAGGSADELAGEARVSLAVTDAAVRAALQLGCRRRNLGSVPSNGPVSPEPVVPKGGGAGKPRVPTPEP